MGIEQKLKREPGFCYLRIIGFRSHNKVKGRGHVCLSGVGNLNVLNVKIGFRGSPGI